MHGLRQRVTGIKFKDIKIIVAIIVQHVGQAE